MTRAELLETCKDIVTNQRQSQYGTPEENFSQIAAVWSIYLHMKLAAHDVAIMMILLKVIRSKNSPSKEDTWIDIAGYAACGCEVATKTQPQDNKIE